MNHTERRFYLVQPVTYTGEANTFTYYSDIPLPQGQIVSIPLGRRKSIGVIISTAPEPTFKTRSAHAVDDLAILPTYLIALASWLSEFYVSSPSSVWSAMIPSGIEKKRHITKPKKPLVAHGLPKQPLTNEQESAMKSLMLLDPKIHLLQGVTGSGKTRLYLELASIAINEGKSVIILVPEITLTPQVVSQFEHVFGDITISTHSKLTEAQRHKIWNAANVATSNSKPSIIVGPRSCLFLPLHNLGLIIVDESHETTYKQDQHPRYNASTVAAQLSRITGAKVVFGSATPSLTERHLADQKRIGHVRLTKRANNIDPPVASIIDLRQKENLKHSKVFAQPLIDAISDTLRQGRQSLLYLNRRGSASSQICGDCGHVSLCPNCLLPLTFHADWMRLVCHHCNFRRPHEAICPECKGMNMKLLGGGTKRVEEESARLWPHARIARLDRDSANLSHIKSVFAGLKSGEIDIIIGTQMIAKGLDLPNIDTVGVVNADTMLHIPEYSAAERTFQLLSQVSGRSGRGDRPGKVYIQTHTPNHPAIIAAAHNDYENFVTSEFAHREVALYPPYSFLLKLTVSATKRDSAITKAEAFAEVLRRHSSLHIIGPAPSYIETSNGKYSWVITVKAAKRTNLVAIANQLPSTDWSADLDPSNLL